MMTDMTHPSKQEPLDYVQLTADVVAAYVEKNVVQRSDLPTLIKEVHQALRATATTSPMVAEEILKATPKVSVRKSITDDELTCLECGDKFKSLKRHLMTRHSMNPEQYRERFTLPTDYPMVAPAYAEKRSQLARDAGLGQLRSRARSHPRVA